MKIPCTGIVVFLLLLLPNKNNAVSSIVRGRHEELKSALTSFNNKQSALSAKAAVVVGLRGGGGRPTKVAVSPKPTTASSASSVATTTATASEGVTIINLVKSIVGAAVFGLPAGIAAFGSAPSAIVPALILLVAIGGLATHGFVSIGTVCRLTQSTTYKQAWSNTVGPNTAYIPALACFMVTLCTVLTYSMILADTVPAMVQSLTLGHVVPGRTLGLLVTTTLVILPLCLMRSLAALAPFSFFGILGMVFTGVCMVIRWLSGAYTNESGSFAATLAPALRPVFGTKGWSSVFSPNAAILISMLSTAYMAHYNAPKFYWELRNKAAYNSVVIKSFGWAMVLMSVMATAGYLTFGAASQSLILNNYSGSADTLIALSRMAVTLSLIFTYPLAFVGVRDGFLDLINVPIEKRTRTVSDMWTIVWLTIITGLAYTLTDIRVILSLGGATWGNLLVYVFPALMIVRGAASSNSNVKRELLPKVALSRATGLLGVVMGVVGTVKAIQAL